MSERVRESDRDDNQRLISDNEYSIIDISKKKKLNSLISQLYLRT